MSWACLYRNAVVPDLTLSGVQLLSKPCTKLLPDLTLSGVQLLSKPCTKLLWGGYLHACTCRYIHLSITVGSPIIVCLISSTQDISLEQELG